MPLAPWSVRWRSTTMRKPFCERYRAKGLALGLTRIGAHAESGDCRRLRRRPRARSSPTCDYHQRRRRDLEGANNHLLAPASASARRSLGKVEDLQRPPESATDLVLRGKTEALRAFEPLRPEQYESHATKSYLEAFAKLEASDPGAVAAFAAHLGKEPADQLASFHLKRLLNGATGTRIAME